MHLGEALEGVLEGGGSLFCWSSEFAVSEAVQS